MQHFILLTLENHPSIHDTLSEITMTNNIIMTKVEIDHFHKIKRLIGYFLILPFRTEKPQKVLKAYNLEPVLQMNFLQKVDKLATLQLFSQNV